MSIYDFKERVSCLSFMRDWNWNLTPHGLVFLESPNFTSMRLLGQNLKQNVLGFIQSNWQNGCEWTDARGKTHRVSTYCDICNGKPSFCITIFKLPHSNHTRSRWNRPSKTVAYFINYNFLLSYFFIRIC